MKKIYVPLIDNGMGLCRTRWAISFFGAAISGAFSGREVTWQYYSYPYPNGACNAVADAFMKSGCDEMFLHDLDIVYTSKQLEMLLSHDVPYVGGIVPKRTLGLEIAAFNHEPFAPDAFAEGVNPLVDADCGRGFVRIHRSVFETVKPHVPTYVDDQGNGEIRSEYFQSKPGGHSEDFAFCELYRKLGGKPCVDQRILVGHEGAIVYPVKGTF